MARPKTPTKAKATSTATPSTKDSTTKRKSTTPSTATTNTSSDAPDVSASEKARITSRPSPLFFGWLVLPFLVTFAHVVYAPYTKVEETPALHAVHDILKYGVHPGAIKRYEHVVYPGAVPRSIIPSLVVAAITKPLMMALRNLTLLHTGLEVQTLTRLVLAAIFSHSLGHLTQSIALTSSTAAQAFILLSLSQFHVPFYAGRFLPNFLALPPVLYAFSLIIRHTTGPSSTTSREGLKKALVVLTFTCTVVRLELAPLVAAVALVMVLRKDIPVVSAIGAGAAGGLAGLAATALVDGYFYRLSDYQFAWWPELSAFMFNIPQGRAAEWGVMPWWHYVVALPKLLMASLPLELVYPYLRGNNADRSRLLQLLLVPSAVLIASLSLIGHKEWRFVVYVVPLLNVLAAFSAASLWEIRSKTYQPFIKLCLLGAVLANILASAFMTFISAKNYPGGEVGLLLQNLAQGTTSGKVYIPAAALHTGATAYTLPPATLALAPIGASSAIKPAELTIDRPESSYAASRNATNNSPGELWDQGYEWVVTDDWGLFEGDVESGMKGGWEVAGEVSGYRGVGVGKEWPFLRVDVGRRLAIMRRK